MLRSNSARTPPTRQSLAAIPKRFSIIPAFSLRQPKSGRTIQVESRTLLEIPNEPDRQPWLFASRSLEKCRAVRCRIGVSRCGIAGRSCGGDNAIQVALVGCGGRGTGAAINALASPNGPVKLVAMADVFKDRLDSSYREINRRHQQRVDAPEARRFVSFDGYREAMDALRPGDVVIRLVTPPGVSLGAFQLRDRKTTQRFHGKADLRGRAKHAPNDGLGRRIGKGWPESRRRPDVPALHGPPRIIFPDSRRPNRRVGAAPRLPHGGTDGLGILRAQARRHQ